MLKLLFTAAQIDTVVIQLAQQVTADLAQRNPVVVSVLKGSFVFSADLLRRLPFPLTLDFACTHSYRGALASPSERLVCSLPSMLVKGRSVLLVDDILDTGRTASFLWGWAQAEGAVDVRLCVLLDKPERREVSVVPTYKGFTVARDQFVVGYGLDLDEKYRHLPEIFVAER